MQRPASAANGGITGGVMSTPGNNGRHFRAQSFTAQERFPDRLNDGLLATPQVNKPLRRRAEGARSPTVLVVRSWKIRWRRRERFLPRPFAAPGPKSAALRPP